MPTQGSFNSFKLRRKWFTLALFSSLQGLMILKVVNALAAREASLLYKQSK